MRGLAAGALLALLLLSGCTGMQDHATMHEGTSTASSPASQGPTSASASKAPPGPKASTAPNQASLHGVVVDAAIHPLAANVTLVEKHSTQATKNGVFRFDGLAAGTYNLQVRSPGYRAQDLVVETGSQEVRVVLEALPGAFASNVTVHYHGVDDCAVEVLIIPTSCDAGKLGLKYNVTFTSSLDQAWRTVVADLVFDPSSQPLLDGLRVTLSGKNQTDTTTTYQRYGQFDGAASFSFRLEPNGTYPGTTAGPLPEDIASLQFQVFPQSKLWHATCFLPLPDSQDCFLGVGAGVNVEFDLYVTTFYGQPAPAGFSFIKQA